MRGGLFSLGKTCYRVIYVQGFSYSFELGVFSKKGFGNFYLQIGTYFCGQKICVVLYFPDKLLINTCSMFYGENYSIVTINYSPKQSFANLSGRTAPDEALFFNQKVFIFFLFFHENICCGYSLELLFKAYY